MFESIWSDQVKVDASSYHFLIWTYLMPLWPLDLAKFGTTEIQLVGVIYHHLRPNYIMIGLVKWKTSNILFILSNIKYNLKTCKLSYILPFKIVGPYLKSWILYACLKFIINVFYFLNECAKSACLKHVLYLIAVYFSDKNLSQSQWQDILPSYSHLFWSISLCVVSLLF